MKKLILITLLLLATLLVSVSCGVAPLETDESYGSSRYSQGGDSGGAPPPEIDMEEVVKPAPPVVINTGSGEGESWATERMIVRTGDVSLVVEDVPVAIDRITVMADDFGGYVVSSRVWKDGERLAGSIAIRVPVEYFEDTLRMLRGLAVEVTSEQTSSKDVTEEYVDLSAQLQNLEATEAQLLVIMDKAETVEDILDVQRELSRTRGEIEQIKARMQYLERTSATSLINVRLEQSQLYFEFTADKRRGLKEGEKVQFTIHQISGGFAPYSYEWDFGDGEISTDENPIHAYKSEGSYTVTLTVTDDEGNTDTEIRSDYVVVLPGWSPGNIASSAWSGLVIFGRVLGNIFIWLGIFSPVWIVIGGIVIWRLRRRRKKAE